ncbi:MAG: hypothetical protein WAK18_00610 [Nocardioidaceae bacterium]
MAAQTAGGDARPGAADGGVLGPQSGHDPTVIDCDHCSMRGIGCGDCVVTVLLGGPPFGVELDDVEKQAIDVLAQAGLVPPLRMVHSLDTLPVDAD